jgi:uncharacterized alkaline shock family protein YloU
MSDASQQTRQTRGASADIVAPAHGVSGTEVRGTVRIAPAVLIELIEVTVQGMDGVAGLRSRNKRHRPDARPPIGKSYDNGKVLVSVNGDQITTDITLAVHRGVNVTDLSSSIQRGVGTMVGKMLGMTVQTVNIYIDEIVSAPDGT